MHQSNPVRKLFSQCGGPVRKLASTRGDVSAAKKTAWRTSVLFTRTPVSTFSAYCSLKTIGPISTKFKYVLPLIYTTSQTKFERNSPRSLLVYAYLKSRGFYSSFSSSNSSHKMNSLINASANNLLVHGFKQNFGHHQRHLWPICPNDFE